MNVRIAQPLGYSELGNRGNNEDFIYPDPQYVSEDQRWFLVCDGVGGAEKGEVASMLAATSLDGFFQQRPDSVATDDYVQQAVSFAERQFKGYLQEHEQAQGMATTVTLLYLHEAGATVAHIGDSRVYHIRNGEIIWRTDDHSYVNELLKAGVLTPDEAHHHPQRNIITRALQGGEKPVEASVQLINDLQAGDYFFLCTDGVLERVSDELIEGTLRDDSTTNELKLSRLRNYSSGNTRDNFTAYLIQIKQVTGTVNPAYRVAPPVYERFQTGNDSDESITLINVPIPDAVKEAPPEPQPELQPVLSQASQPVETIQRAILQQPTSRMTSSEENRDTVKRQSPKTAQSRQKSPGMSRILMLAVVGLLLGAGGYFVWHEFLNKPEPSAEPTKLITQATPTVGKASAPTEDSSMPTDLPAQATGSEEVELEELTLPPIKTNEQSASDGLSVEAKERTPDDKKPDRAETYEVVQKVDKQVSVVRDPETRLLRLRKANGTWLGNQQYTKIGTFENGIAPVKTDKGADMYLSKSGKWFDEAKTASRGKIAVRKGNRWGYLNLNGDVSIDLRYDKAESFQEDNTAEVTLNGKPIRIDKQGIPQAGTTEGKSADSKKG